MHELSADVIIAGGMGQRAVSMFTQNGIKVVIGVPALEPLSLVKSYLDNTLETGANVCDY